VPLELIRKGLPVIVGNGQGLLDVIYVDDVARAMVAAAESPQADGEVFNIGHELLTFNEFYAYLGRMLDRPVRHLPAAIPRALMSLAERGPGPVARRLQSARKVASFLLRASENTSRYPSSKAASLLRFSPTQRVAAAMLATEVWARKQEVIGRRTFSLPGYGPLHFRPAALAHPETERDIVQMVGIAVRAEVPAKAIGSLHSLCPIPETDGVCLVLDRYNRLLEATGTLVTVEAGMKLRDLHNHLAARGLALPVSGSISEQTVSGAVSTATHGGSIQYPALSDYVEAVRIVRADGSVAVLDRSHDLFPAAVVSLGVLGVMSTVTFRCVPAFQLESRSVVMTVPELMDNFDALHRRSRYVSVVYFPIIDRVEVVTADLAPSSSARSSTRGTKTAGSNGLAQRLVLLVAKSAAWMLHRYGFAPVRRALAARSAGRFYESRAGRSDHVLAVGDVEGARRSPMTMQDMELAVRYEQARTALGALRDFFATTGRYPLMPIHIRCSSQSSQWMSPAYERDVCYFDFWQYPRSDAAFQEIYDVMDRFECRFHWGKETRADRQTIRARYPKWDDFARVRQDWDPRGVFLNAYMAAFFGEPPAAGRRE
jgi:FAD/FMN-containing dehydrogenase